MPKKRKQPRAYHLKLYTGPLNKSDAKMVSRKLKRAKIDVVTSGTSHIYVDVPAQDCTDARIRIENKWRGKYGRAMWPTVTACSIRGSGLSGRRRRRK